MTSAGSEQRGSEPSAPGPPVAGSEGATIATWDLGGDGPAVIVLHATGFHGRCYQPMAAEGAAAFRWWAIDLPGHGQSDPYPDGDYAWWRFRDDTLAAVEALGLERPFVFGHSLGGAVALLAEAEAPGTFAGMFLWEPIVLGPALLHTAAPRDMSALALRRRPRFPSPAEAVANYASKPPFSRLRADALLAYVEGGVRPAAGGGVALACAPETEARVFEGALSAGVADVLDKVATPVALACGAIDPHIDRDQLKRIAGRLPRAAVDCYAGLGHLGPLEAPHLVAGYAAAAFAPPPGP